MQNPNISPVNPLPPVVTALFLAIMGIEAVFSLGAYGLAGGAQAVGWRVAAIQDYGFSSDVFRWMLENGRYPPEHMMRFLTYAFVHGTFTHALFVGVMLLAMGKFVGEVLAQWAILAVFVVGTVAGALAHGIFIEAQPWLVGGFPGVYGLIGAFTYLLYVRLVSKGSNGARAFALIGFLMAIKLVFGLLFGADATWLADLAGFFAGFAVTIVLAPGGWARLRARLRHD
ncbi:Rhomboid family protein [Lutimaribacter saemankumensis]|uniref:Rhomboid family protein n=2 Tax=Lutimaribacter saemankumensis TaxID=490829 RepID=A0A1G8JDY0_9RHOB|nr:Rhomboid family protein [Lutimaribacter saemankumensis]